MAESDKTPIKLGRFLISMMSGDRDSIKISDFSKYKKVFAVKDLISPGHIFLAALLGGTAAIGIIYTINTAASFSENKSYSLLLPCIFILLILIYRSSQIALLKSCAIAIELVLEETRLRTSRQLTKIDLVSFEHLEKEQILAGLTKNYETIYNLYIPVIQGTSALCLTVFLIIYLAYISVTAAIISVIVSIVSVSIYKKGIKTVQTSLESMSKSEIKLIASLYEVFGGFKELKFNNKKLNLVFEELSLSINNSVEQRIITNSCIIELQVYFSVISYLFAGCVAFLLPILSGHTFAEMGRIIALTLFLIGPVGGLTEAFQSLVKIKFALKSLFDFENRLRDQATEKNEGIIIQNFESIEIKNLSFTRQAEGDDQNFKVGPINLTLTPNQIIFVEGGNGSGKTTMMKMITGLYEYDNGSIEINGISIKDVSLQSYRELFGIIFSDFHLFKKPYGFSAEQLEKLRELTILFGLDKYVDLDFQEDLQSDRLSTGQRKRLALAMALVENPPILIFDEWAADQDPLFRKTFYREILPKLKAEGKSILAITHDDKYFDAADIRYHMDEGKLTKISKRSPTKKQTQDSAKT